MAGRIASAFDEANVIFRARMGGMKVNIRDSNSLPCLPAGSIMPGMALFTEKGYDIVKNISRIPTSKVELYDIDIEKTHNFIANGILTHNCIYSWRGANLKNILSFEKDYPDAKIILLEQNYRSTKNILEAANVVIKKNIYRPDKNLFTDNPTGEKIGLYEALDEVDEADFVATKILEIMDEGEPSEFLSGLAERTREGEPRTRKNSAGFAEIAILYRANFQSRALEEAMLRHNIPYQVLGVKFFERKEIKDTLAYLRAALNPEGLSDIKRIINFPARGIGKVTLVKIFASPRHGGASDTGNLPAKVRMKIHNFYEILEEIKEKIKTEKASQVIKFVVKRSGIERELSGGTEEDMERLENIKELATLALKYDNLANGLGIERLLEDASLTSDQDGLMINQPASVKSFGEAKEKNTKISSVKLMTVHASKGLEFKYVFVAGLEDGLFPHERRNEDSPASAGGYGPLRHSFSEASEAQEEERRLFYVALTRAKEKLFLSFANFRTIFGARNINAPSEFIADIPSDLLQKDLPANAFGLRRWQAGGEKDITF